MARLLVLCLLFLSCGVGRLQRGAGGVAPESEVLRFERAHVGYPRSLVLGLVNTARSSRALSLETSGPFRLSEVPESVRAGSRLQLSVEFDPPFPGEHRGLLSLESEGQAFAISLSGLAEAAPVCPSASPCRTWAFDPETGSCVERELPDETPCSQGCLQGVCRAGACLGAQASCEDFNACTVDACGANGCVHLEADCPAPEDPCKVALCDPSTGCAVADAADGTSCGENDCVTARVCLAGACRSVSVPEGASCAPESPCQGPGVCRARQCVRPAATLLEPVWRVASAGEIVFPGVADAARAVYWLECGRSCELVSVTRDGFPRYRTALRGSFWGVERGRGSVLLAGQLAVVTGGQDFVEAVRAGDGVRAWAVDLRGELMAGVPGSYLDVGPVVEGADAQLYLLARGYSQSGDSVRQHDSWVLSLSPLDGRLRWKKQFLGGLEGLLADEQGAVHFLRSSYGAVPLQPELTSLDSFGVERYRKPNNQGRPLAIQGGHLVHAGPAVSRASDGQLEFALPVLPRADLSPLLGNGALYLLGDSLTDEYAGGLLLHRFDLLTGQPQWATPLVKLVNPAGPAGGRFAATPLRVSQPALTDRGSVLVAFQTESYRGTSSDSSWFLGEVSSAGRQVFSCELPGGGEYAAPALLQDGRWVAVKTSDDPEQASMEVVAFEVGKLSHATSGWTMLGGSESGASRPR